MKITTFILGIFVLVPALMAQDAFAPVARMSDKAPAGLAPKASDVPSKVIVGFPAYPGAVIISLGKPDMIKGEQKLPFINLVSTDSREKVKEFYKSALPGSEGWQWHAMTDMFLQGNNPMAAISGKVPFISISEEPSQSIDTQYLADQTFKSEIKTRIQIVYQLPITK